nr:transposase domain-containing protein [Methylosinus sp. RM1]
MIQTARLNGVDPETWLADVLERMVSGATTNNRLAELLVWTTINATGSARSPSLRPSYRSRSTL